MVSGSTSSSSSSRSDGPGCAAAPASLSAGVMSARRPTGAGWGSFSSMKFDSHRCLLGGSGGSGASGGGSGASDGGESGAFRPGPLGLGTRETKTQNVIGLGIPREIAI